MSDTEQQKVNWEEIEEKYHLEKISKRKLEELLFHQLLVKNEPKMTIEDLELLFKRIDPASQLTFRERKIFESAYINFGWSFVTAYPLTVTGVESVFCEDEARKMSESECAKLIEEIYPSYEIKKIFSPDEVDKQLVRKLQEKIMGVKEKIKLANWDSLKADIVNKQIEIDEKCLCIMKRMGEI